MKSKMKTKRLAATLQDFLHGSDAVVIHVFHKELKKQ